MSNNELSGARPASVKTVAALVLLEAVAVLAYGINYLMHINDPGVLNMSGRIFMVVLCLAAGVWQGWVAFSFFKGRAWTRAAIVAWQLFQVILATTYFQTELIGAAVAAFFVAAIAWYCSSPRRPPRSSATARPNSRPPRHRHLKMIAAGGAASRLDEWAFQGWGISTCRG
ncbi:hypothetical protein [Arthrobacter sp. JCM 19049]|uniref:hypothetical protein n=1 Tax=Arthrobacter sp. JCM 19049 TaxID=1460643 RepID=UPI0006CFDEFD|nr:hypothetical protein [Arthrobacter sp. JCM 19049]